MKAFLGALLLTLMASAAGVFAAVELHELNLATADPGDLRETQAVNEDTQAPRPPIRRRVNYPTRSSEQKATPAPTGI